MNLVFFQIHECSFDKVDSEKKFDKKKKEYYKNHPNFSFVKKKNCSRIKKKILATSSEGIYRKRTNGNYSWIIFTSSSWQTKSIE